MPTGADTPAGQRRRLVKLELAADDALPGEFAPFRLPRRLTATSVNVDGALVRALELSLSGTLTAGSHALPIGRDVALELTVAEVTGFSLSARVGEEAGHPVLLAGEVRFDRPVVLGNVPKVLAALPSLFEDKRLAAVSGWLERIAAQDVPGGLASTLRKVLIRATPWARAPGEADTAPAEPPSAEPVTTTRGLVRVLASGEQLARIHLSGITLRPAARGARSELAFDGYVSWVDQLPLPFARVVLPNAVIPALHRRMSRLFSGNPLATAALHNERIASPRALALGFGRLVEGARGHVAFTLDTVALELGLRLADGTRLRVEVPPLGRASGHAHVMVSQAGDVMTTSLEDASIHVPTGELQGRLSWTGPLPGAPDAAPNGTRLAFTAGPGTRFERLELLLGLDHPGVRGETRATVALTAATVRGGADLGAVRPTIDLELATAWALAGEHRDPRGRLLPRGQGRAEVRVASDAGAIGVALDATAAATLSAELHHTPIPELGLRAPLTTAELALDATAELRATLTRRRDGQRVVTSDGSKARAVLQRGIVKHGDISIIFPPRSHVDLAVHEAALGDDGLGHGRATARWDLGATPLELHTDAGVFAIPTDAARTGARQVTLSAVGGLTVGPATADEGPLELWTLLGDDALRDAIVAAAERLEPRLGRFIREVWRVARRARRVLDEEGVSEPRDAIPRERLARLVARVLGDAPALPNRALPIVTAVTDGHGLDVPATRALLDAVLPTHHGWDRTIDQVLDWLAILLSPTEPLPPRARLAAPPLAEDPALASLLAAVPTAAALYAAAEGAALPGDEPLASALPRLAPYLADAQLDALLESYDAALPAPARDRVHYVQALARRARLVAQSYGGLAHLPQALAVGIFLGDATLVARTACARYTAPDEGAPGPTGVAAIHDTVLGPRAVATLLQAGLTPVWQGRTVQVNQRLLLDYLLDRPPGFSLQVLVELAEGSTRVLASALNALLDLEQDLLREPLDLHAVLGARLGVALPRRADFMADGATPEASYYEALHATARSILSAGRPYLALRQRLQRARVPLRAPRRRPGSARLEAAAQEAVASADAFGHALDLSDIGDDTRGAAAAGYRAAFDRCAELLADAPDALEAPWLRAFFARNHEALVVRSAVQSHLDDVDAVRRWLSVRSGDTRWLEPPARRGPGVQELVAAFVDALYFAPADRAALRGDPLVGLLLPHPPGPLNFTVVSCMGVITDGAQGRELADTFARLERARGVRVVRADTRTLRSLDENARRVVAAISEVTTPWGWLGYSQGCANGLAAESLLATGPPAGRRLLAGLRTRHLLFSAANGSTHGTGADLKFVRALVAGDLALKRFQADFSAPLVELALRGLRLALDSRDFVKTLGGARSLSHDGVVALARDGCFVPHVPTTSVRGRVSAETLPEALEMLSNLLTHQSGSPEHDSQVSTSEAVAWPVHVDGDAARTLEACAIPARVQATHHWAPLSHDVEFVRTQRDVDRAIYDSPRDRLVMPWIEVNARFGLIRPR
ncbi:MAG: hypothetical protein CVU56_12335 [Deltaproteobacteria bacterium HGW-Deltaproteobacteria-14]|jgi:hypothetical protein|nr:MAG: hypothetical protein CVU56_12335 [Deltaproteobacteria bacterium HGW-Deltaproteobacteria-14]